MSVTVHEAHVKTFFGLLHEQGKKYTIVPAADILI